MRHDVGIYLIGALAGFMVGAVVVGAMFDEGWLTPKHTYEEAAEAWIRAQSSGSSSEPSPATTPSPISE